jgi:hypothetical protein
MSIGPRTKGKLPLGDGYDGYTWSVNTCDLGSPFVVQAFATSMAYSTAVLSANGVALATTFGNYWMDDGEGGTIDIDHYCTATVPSSCTGTAGSTVTLHAKDTNKITNPHAVTIGASGVYSVSPSTVTQYDPATTFTVTGAGFTAGTVINVNTVAQTTTYISSTQVSITSQAGHTAGDLLTGGNLTITATTDGYTTITPVTVTVTAWALNTPSGFTAKWDPNSGVTNTGSPSRMSAWVQAISGSIQFAQSTAGLRPQSETNWVFAEDTAQRSMYENTAASSFISASAGTIIAVIKPSTISKNSGTLSANHLALGIGGTFGIYFRNNGPTAYAYNNDGVVDTAAVSCPAAGTAGVYMWRHGSGNIELSVNDGTPASTASGNTNSLGSGISLFGSLADDYFVGRMGVFAFYNVALSAANVTRAVNLLRVQYGI